MEKPTKELDSSRELGNLDHQIKLIKTVLKRLGPADELSTLIKVNDTTEVQLIANNCLNMKIPSFNCLSPLKIKLSYKEKDP